MANEENKVPEMIAADDTAAPPITPAGVQGRTEMIAADDTAAPLTDNTIAGSIPENTEDDGVVFAQSSASPGVRRHATGMPVQHERKKPKKNFLSIPVLIASIALLCAAGAGIMFALSFNQDSDMAMTKTSAAFSETSPSSAQAHNTVVEESSALAVIRVEEADIKKINTESIVFGNSVTVSGIDLSGKTLTEAYDAMQERMLELREKINITVTCDGKNMTLTEDDFSFDSDLADVLIQAYHYSRGELDSPTVETHLNGGKTDFVVTSVLDRDSAANAVKAVSKKFDIQPKDAKVTSFEPTAVEKFKYADGEDGYLIDQKDVRSRIDDIISRNAKTGTINISTVRTPFKRTLSVVKANTKLIASYYTTSANVWASNFNMQLAIKTCNGYIVNPGEVFSFNTMTGDTTTGALGYVQSTAIENGRYVQFYGGGICQASTTIFLCALEADMEILERHAHQFPSSYASRGLDATVDYGNLDMRFKNNKDYPIYIATYVYDYNNDGMNELLVEMYGPLSTEYDEIVSVGWVMSANESGYTARGAKVYFKDGKEIKREYLPIGSYDYHYDDYYTISSMIPADPKFGPENVSPTGKIPAVFSPGGCGTSAPIAYGTAAEVLRKAEENKTTQPDPVQTSKPETASKPEDSSKPEEAS